MTLSLDNGHATFGAYLFLGRIILLGTCVANRAGFTSNHRTSNLFTQTRIFIFNRYQVTRRMRVKHKTHICEDNSIIILKKSTQEYTFPIEGKIPPALCFPRVLLRCRLTLNVRNLVKYLATRWTRAHFLQRPILF